MKIPNHTKELLDDLAESLQIPPSRYEAAERSYKSVGEWLHRDDSSVRHADPKVYIQGSFRLGTVIRPESDLEDYDVDLVCELSLPKTKLTQEELKAQVGSELHAYAKAHRMKEPIEGRRCWTQEYADGAQFHMDTLPAISDANYQRLLLEQSGFSTEWTDTAIAITDREGENFRLVTNDWPHSNPKGYANWYRSRMGEIFENRRRMMALETHASIEDIPVYKVRTPLQSAIQILKCHRDIMFEKRPNDKPISIIVTTLAAHAYQQESTISTALYSILNQMDDFIDYSSGTAWIANPTNPAENFADRWQQYPERETAFYEWLKQAGTDFAAAAQAYNRDGATAVLKPRFGKHLMGEAPSKQRNSSLARVVGRAQGLGKVLKPAHRQTPPWIKIDQGHVRIERATMQRNGFRPEVFGSDSTPLPKQCSLSFHANTNISKPFKVYWQVVNTGRDADSVNDLRGGFDEGKVTSGSLTKNESSLYTGTHSIECFIVKDGFLAAHSGQFIVNIQ